MSWCFRGSGCFDAFSPRVDHFVPELCNLYGDPKTESANSSAIVDMAVALCLLEPDYQVQLASSCATYYDTVCKAAAHIFGHGLCFDVWIVNNIYIYICIYIYIYLYIYITVPATCY